MFGYGLSTLFTILWAMFAVSASNAQSPTIGKCAVLPADNIWNTPIDPLPVLASSGTWITTIGSEKTVHADFGSGLFQCAPVGIPYVAVPGTQTRYPASFTYAGESDPGPYAIPPIASLEGQSAGDRHALSIDTDHCILYELGSAYSQTASWLAGSGAIFDLLSNALRPSGWASADGAGLPVFPGLLRYDEVASGEIRHAVRFTAPQTQRAFVWPARRYASSLTGSQYPPMGARFRLRAGFDIAGYSAANQVILRALKKYGMMLADTGSAWYLSGAPDDRWNNDDLHNLGLIKGSDFEAVDVSSLMIDPNSGQAKQSTAVTVTVGPSTATAPVNTTMQFTATVTNATAQTVDWSVNGAAGGNSSVGWISSSGFYTAPAVPPAGGAVAVQAASSASPSAIGTATVNIAVPTPVSSPITPNSGERGTSVTSNASQRRAAGYDARNFVPANVLSTTENLNVPTFSAAAWGTYGGTNFVLSTGSATYTDHAGRYFDGLYQGADGFNMALNMVPGALYQFTYAVSAANSPPPNACYVNSSSVRYYVPSLAAGSHTMFFVPDETSFEIVCQSLGTNSGQTITFTSFHVKQVISTATAMVNGAVTFNLPWRMNADLTVNPGNKFSFEGAKQTAYPIMLLPTNETGAAPFAFGIKNQRPDQSGVGATGGDNTLVYGYNCDEHGAKIIAGVHQGCFALESNWFTGSGLHQMEWYFSYVNGAGDYNGRPIQINQHIDSHDAEIFLTGSELEVNLLDHSNVIKVDKAGNTNFGKLSGSGNAFACLDSTGKLYRSATPCVP